VVPDSARDVEMSVRRRLYGYVEARRPFDRVA